MSRLRPKMPVARRHVDDVVLELLLGWDERLAHYRAIEHRYGGSQEGDEAGAQRAELDEVIAEVKMFFPRAAKLFDELD